MKTMPSTGAHELIREFEEQKKKKKLQQSAKNSQSPAKRARKSMDVDSEDGEASVSAPKKRSRKSVSEKPTNVDDDDERPVKKARKTTGQEGCVHYRSFTGRRRRRHREYGATYAGADLGPAHQAHRHCRARRQAAVCLLHVVRAPRPRRFCRQTKNRANRQDGQRIREDSKICADKFPKMLIEFYESNLRWKEADNH
ncbi:hypothetical protein C8R46DRAFT_116382 [Mycena filopes]|nr:hypothetical protein C8R46DRAFT_116382 [Mycena filopes]